MEPVTPSDARERRSRSTRTSTARTSARSPTTSLDGLTRPFKELPPKHFYDARGAELFDRICELPEYYPTRAERAILEARAEEIVELTGAAELVELGSGTAAKTRVLLDALHDAGTLRRYVPARRDREMVRECAAALVEEYPGLLVHGVVGDFERHLAPPARGRSARASSRSSAARSATSRRAAGGASCAGSRGCWAPTTTCCWAPTSSRTRRARGRLRRQRRASPPSSTATSCTCSTASSTPTSTSTTSTTSRSSTASTSGSRCACARAARSTSTSARLDLDVAVRRRARSCAPRSARSSRPSACEGDLAAAGLELVRWFTDADGLFALTAVAAGRGVGSAAPCRSRTQERSSSAAPRASARRPSARCTSAARAVTIADVNAEAGEALAGELGLEFVACDVREEEQVEAAVDAAAEADGGLRIAVCCAGTGWAQKVAGVEGPAPARCRSRRSSQINLIGTFNVLRFAAAAMIGNEPDAEDGERGVCVNTASIAAFDGQVGQIAYSASKGGVVGMTLPAARDLAQYGIRVNTIAPGLFDTPLLAALPEEARQKLGAGDPVPAAPRRARASTRSSPARSSRTACSTARRSGSTARCGCRRARTPPGTGSVPCCACAPNLAARRATCRCSAAGRGTGSGRRAGGP